MHVSRENCHIKFVKFSLKMSLSCDVGYCTIFIYLSSINCLEIFKQISLKNCT